MRRAVTTIPAKTSTALTDEMKSYLDLGYTQVKIKIGGAPLGDDLHRIEAVLKLLPAGDRLSVDANGRFDLKTALEYAQALAPYKLRWYEEPGDPLDFKLNAEVASASTTPIATGENLFAMQEARNLIRYGGMNPQRDFLQMDPALSYGVVEFARTLQMLRENGWSPRRCIPHGGHQMALHVAAGMGLGGNESYPGVFLPFGGFADEPRHRRRICSPAGCARHRHRTKFRFIPTVPQLLIRVRRDSCAPARHDTGDRRGRGLKADLP